MQGGIEWLVDAFGCAPPRLRDQSNAIAFLDRIVVAMDLRVVGTVWHAFGGPGGVTVMYLLAESHLTIHTFPETSTLTMNVYCCVPRQPAPWREFLVEYFDAREVTFAEHVRGKPP